MSAKPKEHLVILQPSGRRGYVKQGMHLRAAARQLGVEIESICAENATCGKCKVLIEEGDFARYDIRSRQNHLSEIGADEATYFEKRPRMLKRNGWTVGQVRLSCQAMVCGDVLVNVPEESRGNKQIVRKSASTRSIDIVPAIRKYFIQMEPATLENPLGDWDRLAEALVQAMHLVRRGETKALPEADDINIDLHVLRQLPDLLRQDEWRVTVTVWMDREVINVQPGYHENSYGVAVDIGTTTIAAYLCDLRTGEIVATESEMNPQIVYGEDIMSRIHYTMNESEGLENLNQAVVTGLNKVFKRAAQKARLKSDDILDVVLVGNTTMHHLVLNISPRHLGLAPYVPALRRPIDIKAREVGLKVNRGANVHLLPIEASFVGADNIAVLIAEEPYNQDEQLLIIDVGTNAELVLGNRERLICTSTPTGPAFEGAHIEYGMRAAPGAIERVEIDPTTLEPRYQVIGAKGWNTDLPEGKRVKGICGSAIIDAIAEMFRAGILNARGRFTESLDTPRVRKGEFGEEYVIAWADETSIDRDIPITMQDVRQIQLAKAALYVAARLLLQKMGVERPDKIILAGGFGSYIDKTKAMILGMIPDCPLENVYAIGNAAGDGARFALLNKDKRREAVEVAQRIERIELPTDPDFQNQFMLALNFPHMMDLFPSVEHLITHKEADKLAGRFLKEMNG